MSCAVHDIYGKDMTAVKVTYTLQNCLVIKTSFSEDFAPVGALILPHPYFVYPPILASLIVLIAMLLSGFLPDGRLI